jgi:hypothetical protein
LARSFHVFEHRRIVQALLLAGLFAPALLLPAVGASTAPTLSPPSALAMGALLLLALLALSHAMSFQPTDVFLERELGCF